MALTFVIKTYEQILNDMLNRVSNSIDKREGSIVDVSLRPAAWTIEGIYLDLAALRRDAYATTAIGEALDNLAAMRGIYRKPATYAVRLGVFDINVSVGDRFRTINGDRSVTYSVTALRGLQPTGYYTAELTCEVAGTIGNEYAGQILPVTNITGLGYAQLQDIIISGADVESDDELRERYLFDLRRQPFAGNIAAYIKWFLDGSEMNNPNSDDLGAVQVYPHSRPDTGNMAGYVTNSVVDRNYMPISQDLINTLQYNLCPPEAGNNTPSANGYGYAPIGAIAYVVTPTQLTINVTIDIELRNNYTVEALREEITTAIEAYFAEIRREFGESANAYEVNYTKIVYMSRIAAAVVGLQGIINVIQVQLNNSATDITLTMQPTLQQLPILGTVTINAV